MRLTAEEIRNQRFKTKIKGLDQSDVMTYLQLVADDFQESENETARFKEQLKKQDQILRILKEREIKLKNIIDTLSKDKEGPTGKDPKKKGEEIIQNALQRAREIKEITTKELYEMEKEILMLEKHKKQLMGSIKQPGERNQKELPLQ